MTDTALSHTLAHLSAVQRQCPCGLQVKLREGDLSWQAFLAAGESRQQGFKPHVAAAEDRINILFSSGTTGTTSCPLGPAFLVAYLVDSTASPSHACPLPVRPLSCSQSAEHGQRQPPGT